VARGLDGQPFDCEQSLPMPVFVDAENAMVAEALGIGELYLVGEETEECLGSSVEGSQWEGMSWQVLLLGGVLFENCGRREQVGILWTAS
jgi:hypothetical protein